MYTHECCTRTIRWNRGERNDRVQFSFAKSNVASHRIVEPAGGESPPSVQKVTTLGPPRCLSPPVVSNGCEVELADKSTSMLCTVVSPRMYALAFKLASTVLQYIEQSEKLNTPLRNFSGWTCSYRVQVNFDKRALTNVPVTSNTYEDEGQEGEHSRPNTCTHYKHGDAL